MNHLLRELAPISQAGWSQLDDEAKERLTPALAGRRLVDFADPLGWEHSARNLGRTDKLASPVDGVSGRQRRVLPVVELRADFEVSREELQDADRGADDMDMDSLDAAARQIAIAENTAVFTGWEGVVTGITAACTNEPIALGSSPDQYPQAIAGAVELLLQNGIEGPFGLALGNDEYKTVVETTEHGGYPLLKHLREVVEGSIVWTPGLSGAILLSQRGGDFLFGAGQDLSIGYSHHDAETVSLYLQESFTFHVATPDAAVILTV